MATDERNRTLDLRPPPFPEDFGQRLEGLKELSGLSWGEFAELLGVTQRGLLKWRRGGPPSGAYFWAIMEVARDLPGGFELMMDGDAGSGVEDSREPPWPEDFPERLGRLEDLSGISLEEFARAFGLAEDRAKGMAQRRDAHHRRGVGDGAVGQSGPRRQRRAARALKSILPGLHPRPKYAVDTGYPPFLAKRV